MADRKRKWRWSSKGNAGPKAGNNANPLESEAHVKRNKNISRDVAASLNFNDNESPEDAQLVSKIRRNGSKLLSFVGLPLNASKLRPASGQHQASDTQITDNTGKLGYDSQVSERDIAHAIVGDDIGPDKSRILAQGAYESTKPPSAGPTDLLLSSHIKEQGPCTDRGKKRTCDSPFEHLIIQCGSSGPNGIRESVIHPGFAHQLSHKISQTFGNPTIVHRPNLRTRPSLLSNQEGLRISEIRSDKPLEPQESASPSSYNRSESASLIEPSTGKTSLESAMASLHSVNGNAKRNRIPETVKLTDVPVYRDNALTPIQETPHIVCPTLATAENTANAKIFFETHFNSLLADHASPRSMRKRQFEFQLETQALPEDQQRLQRLAWINAESDHLRNTRVLKSSPKRLSKGSKVATAGYQVVRVLGKGSFGVVRLVREKDPNILQSSSIRSFSSPLLGNTSNTIGPRGEMAFLRDSAVDVLRSTLDLHKLYQRPSGQQSPKEVYAMKVIRKSDMLRNCQEGHLRAERDFLVASEHSHWVVPLFASFQDHTNLYLIMEYMVGGDFLGLLFRKNILKEKHARWYIAEMILCVEETHRNKWIHRDIKPDNFLISSSGHLKISDFGLAFDGHWAHDQRYFKSHRNSLLETLGIQVKGDQEDQEEDTKKKARSNLAHVLTGRKREAPKVEQVDGPSENETILQWRNRNGKRKMAASIVGTSQYMAPEVIRGDAYDGRCDWWSIGIILYECLYGFTPFVCENREETKAKILNNANSLIFPTEKEVDRKEKISYEAMELINSLLQEKEHRLSSKKYRLNDWQHSSQLPGQLVERRSDPQAQDYRGHFVYPDDASDIKAHPFFSRTAWDRLHLSRPPFVPDVKGHDDTRYFDEEEPVSDVDDASSQSEGEQLSDKAHEDEEATECLARNVDDGLQMAMRIPGGYGTPVGGLGMPIHTKTSKMKKEKKRPRDRVLRDKELGKIALDLRKKGAFLGYTYRRPKLLSLEGEGQKQQNSRRGLMPSFEHV